MTTTNTKRSANWTSQEDEQLSKSWVHISEDPIRANQMKREQFWDRAAADFNKYAPSGAREAKSLMHRWGHLQKATLKFSGIYSRIEGNPPSGSTPTDWLRSAKETFLDDTGKHFPFESSWIILRDVGKWKALVAPPKPTPTTSSVSQTPTPSNPGTPAPENTPIETRPIGSKAAKRELGQSEFLQRKLKILEHNSKQTKERVAEFKRSNDLQERLIEADLLKTEAELRAQRLVFMQKDPKDCPDEFAREFLLMEKQRIINEMRAQQKQQAPTTHALQTTTDTSKASTSKTAESTPPDSPTSWHLEEDEDVGDLSEEQTQGRTSEPNPESELDTSLADATSGEENGDAPSIDPLLHSL